MSRCTKQTLQLKRVVHNFFCCSLVKKRWNKKVQLTPVSVVTSLTSLCKRKCVGKYKQCTNVHILIYNHIEELACLFAYLYTYLLNYLPTYPLTNLLKQSKTYQSSPTSFSHGISLVGFVGHISRCPLLWPPAPSVATAWLIVEDILIHNVQMYKNIFLG